MRSINKQYSNVIKRNPLLTKNQEIELANKIKKGDTADITGYIKDHTIGKQSNGPETYLNRVKFVSSQ